MPKRSNEFQKLIDLVQVHLSGGAEVKESKLLKDRISNRYREVDVVVRGKVGLQPVIVSIECRDHKRPADVTWVDAMKAKHERLPTSVLPLASRRGFTKQAEDIAEKYGIELFTLENQESKDIESMLGPSGSLWHKSFNLSAKEVRVRAAEVGELRPETVVTSPDNLLYHEDGTELCALKALVDRLLASEYARKYVFENGSEEHVWFELKWLQPADHLSRPLYMMKLEPRTLRKAEWIHIGGPCKIEIGTFGMRYGNIGPVKVAWGKGTIAGNEALALATQSETGERKLSLTFKGKPGVHKSA
jgi:hypothetical protein